MDTVTSIDDNVYKEIEHTYKDEPSCISGDMQAGSFAPAHDFIVESRIIPVKAIDVAAYILAQIGTCTTMKLHKLLYYCQAWSLVWDEKPLFDDEIQAWANGPVIPNVFYYHKGLYSVSSKDFVTGNPDKLSADQKETIDSVIDFYGKKPAQWLINLTHSEAPWQEARKGLEPMERGHNIITLSAMADYYSSL